MSGGVCFVDTETTGLDPDLHEIWEVGLITSDDTEHCWQLEVDLAMADPIALNIGRYHERHGKGYTDLDGTQHGTDVYDGRTFARAFVELTRGHHLAGAVVSFDAERLWRLLRVNGECPMWHYHLIDVEALAAGFIAGSRNAFNAATVLTGEAAWAGTKTMAAAEGPDAAPPWNSHDLSLAVGVDPEDFDRHTALGDARWAKAIYQAVTGA